MFFILNFRTQYYLLFKGKKKIQEENLNPRKKKGVKKEKEKKKERKEKKKKREKKKKKRKKKKKFNCKNYYFQASG